MRAEPAAGPRKVTSIEGITEYAFENGLRALLVPDDSRPTVTVNMTVFVGSRHEGYGEAGMAHLLEHMVFKGTPTHPRVPQVLQAHGARFNGTTWVDRTNYFETLPASDENLEFALKLEADRLVNSFIKGEDLTSEMTVVRNEFERGENSPSRILGQRMMSAAYEWHNYGKSTIGNRSDIERVPVESLREFYQRFYQPDNTMVVVAGKFDEAKALGWIQQYFGSLPRPERKLNTTYTEEPPQDGERMVTLRRVGDVALAGVAYHIPAGSHEEFAAIEVLENILTRSPTGRLYKKLVDTQKASSVSGAAFAWHDPGLLRLMCEVTPGNPPEIVLEILLETTEEVASGGVTEREVERAKVSLMKQRELSAADTSGIAVELSEWAAQGDWRLYFVHRDRLEAVTPEAVGKVAGKYLRRNNRTVGLYIPSMQSERIEVAATPNLAKMIGDYKGRDDVALGESFDVSPQNIEKRLTRSKLSTGIETVLLPKKNRGETVQLRLVLRYGSAESLKKLATAAEFLPDLMVRGTQKLSREELQDELDLRRARISTVGAAGVAIFSVQTQRKHLPEVLELLRQILREPSLPESELEILRQRQMTGLEQSRTEPRALAARELGRRMSPYPPGDVRYVRTIPEEIVAVEQLQLAQIKELHRKFLNGAQGQLVVVGDFDPAEMVPALEKLVAEWTSEVPYERIVRIGVEELTTDKGTILTPDKANAVYYAGLSVPMRDEDPDYAALTIGNFILGAGALSSRLGDRIRQREGLSYGVSSSFSADPLDERGSISVMAICNPENIGKVETAVREELERLIAEGPEAEELQRAIDGFLQRQEVTRTDDAALAQMLSSNLYAGRTMTYYRDQEARIAALKPADVVAALKKHVDPKELSVVVAGDFEKAAVPAP